MKEFLITSSEEGQRFDKYLKRILPEAGSGFLYKMLRKKNITLNNKKAEGRELLQSGDCVKIFFTDETFDKFSGNSAEREKTSWSGDGEEYVRAYHSLKGISVLYEDRNVLLLVKPKGVLSQKAAKQDLSLNEWMLGYLLVHDKIKQSDFRYFKPSVLNRLDRNTSGIVICGKTLAAGREISKMLKERTLKKFYLTRVEGILSGSGTLTGYHRKDSGKNQAVIYQNPPKDPENCKKIITKYRVLEVKDNTTKLEVELVTGKSHQIRAHFASVHHPVVGDRKYGSSVSMKDGQILHCYKIVFPKISGELADLSERVFIAEPEVI